MSAHITEILGGARVLRRRSVSSKDLIELCRTGLPYSSLEAVRKTLGLTKEEIALSLAIPARTLNRRRREARLSMEESDRLVRLARIAAHGLRVFGERGKMVRWLHKANRALGNERPLALLDTDIGAQRVEETLGRIEHGIVS